MSFGGRCHLTGAEHIRKASGEEIGSAFAIRATQEDLHRLLSRDPDDPQAFDGEPAFDDELQPPGLAGEAAPELGPEDPEEEPGRSSSTRKRSGGERFPQQARASRRIRGKTAAAEAIGEGGGGHLGDDENLPNYRDLDGDEDERPEEAMMTKKAKTTRGREKQLEKEIPWSMIPPELHERFRQAEQKQWGEHVKYEAMEPVSLQESREILASRGHRVLPSRFAYKDKWWSKRKRDPSLDWRPKARLVIGGHLDPDLSTGRLQTDAPTVSRQGVMALLKLLSSNLKHGWKGFAGDITAAFLQGEPLERELYIRQPKCGLGNLHPEQLVRLTKGVFGLVDSPNAWWKKFRTTVMSTASGKSFTIRQCPLDPCIFMVQEFHAEDDNTNCSTTKPVAYFAVHVDDVLVVGQEEICELLKQELSQVFPIDEWEGESFDYIGFIEIDEDGIKVSQSAYVDSRLFEVDVETCCQDEEPASEEQRLDNRSLIGALSWLASQSRPDLQTGVSMCQQLQKSPSIGDVRFTNALARRAHEHKEMGIFLRPVNLDKAVLLCYHDTGWANAPQDPEDPFYVLSFSDEEIGRIRDGPFALKERRAKRGNSKIASQLGTLYLLADEDILHGNERSVSVIDWKSSACARVCRSTFASETMACMSAVESADYLQSFFETLLTGRLCRHHQGRLRIRFLSDCRSLYDHLTREGIPRVASDRRLAIDLAAIREDLKRFGRLAWIPTEAQLADILTKPMKAHAWWKSIVGPTKLTFKEETLVPEESLKQCKSVKGF